MDVSENNDPDLVRSLREPSIASLATLVRGDPVRCDCADTPLSKLPSSSSSSSSLSGSSACARQGATATRNWGSTCPAPLANAFSMLLLLALSLPSSSCSRRSGEPFTTAMRSPSTTASNGRANASSYPSQGAILTRKSVSMSDAFSGMVDLRRGDVIVVVVDAVTAVCALSGRGDAVERRPPPWSARAEVANGFGESGEVGDDESEGALGLPPRLERVES